MSLRARTSNHLGEKCENVKTITATPDFRVKNADRTTMVQSAAPTATRSRPQAYLNRHAFRVLTPSAIPFAGTSGWRRKLAARVGAWPTRARSLAAAFVTPRLERTWTRSRRVGGFERRCHPGACGDHPRRTGHLRGRDRCDSEVVAHASARPHRPSRLPCTRGAPAGLAAAAHGASTDHRAWYYALPSWWRGPLQCGLSNPRAAAARSTRAGGGSRSRSASWR